jgi:hypothetical protein
MVDTTLGAAQKGDVLTSTVAHRAPRSYWMVRRTARRFFRQLPAFRIVWYELRACQHYWYNKSEERRPRSWRAFPAGAIFSWRCPLMILMGVAWPAQRAVQREHALPFTPDSRSQFIPATTRFTTSLKQRI